VYITGNRSSPTPFRNVAFIDAFPVLVGPMSASMVRQCCDGISASGYASDVSPELEIQLAHSSMTAGA